MKNFLLYSLLCSFIFIGFGCKDCEDPTNPECENYDPCYGLSPVTASFEMYEYAVNLEDNWLKRFNIPQQPMLDDTAINHTISFEAPEGFTKYTWIVGAETITQRKFSRSHFPTNTDISIMLIVKGDIHPCFPDDDGIDTLVKNLFVQSISLLNPAIQYSFMKGIYQGAYVNTPLDTFTIRITEYQFNDVYQEYYREPRIYNLPPNICDVLVCDSGYTGTRNQMPFVTQGLTNDVCGLPSGIVTTPTLDSIDIRYLDRLDDKFYHFRGKRIK